VLPAGGLTIHVSHGHELGSPTPAKLLERYAGDVLGLRAHAPAARHPCGWSAGGEPGAAGPRRFDLMPSVARLTVEGSRASVDLVELRL
jgi:hypothetical protein